MTEKIELCNSVLWSENDIMINKLENLPRTVRGVALQIEKKQGCTSESTIALASDLMFNHFSFGVQFQTSPIGGVLLYLHVTSFV